MSIVIGLRETLQNESLNFKDPRSTPQRSQTNPWCKLLSQFAGDEMLSYTEVGSARSSLPVTFILFQETRNGKVSQERS